MNAKLKKILDNLTINEEDVERVIERFSNNKRWQYISIHGHRNSDSDVDMDDYFEHVNKVFKDKIDFISIEIKDEKITFKQNKLELKENENLIFKFNGKSIKKEQLMDAIKNIVLIDGVNMNTIKELTGKKIKKSEDLSMSIDDVFLLLASDELQSNISSVNEPLMKPYISTTKASSEKLQEYLKDSGLLEPLFSKKENKIKELLSSNKKNETKPTKQKI
jgi:hypothetical protein